MSQSKSNQAITISIEALYILYLLQKNKFEGYIVGGAVRDTLLNSFAQSVMSNDEKSSFTVSANDYDFTTNAKPEEIQKIFPENFYENIFGTVGIAQSHLHEQMKRTVKPQQSSNEKNKETQDLHEDKLIDLTTATKIHDSLKETYSKKASDTNDSDASKKTHKEIYEITTYRCDGTYTDHRRPESVTWGKTLEEDLSRRDFTINALAISISQSVLENIDYSSAPNMVTIEPSDYTIIDKHEGITDLEAGIIATVGNPDKRFQEDALRMLRAVRFSVQLNMQIDSDTFESIITNAQLLQHISFERISDEFIKMLSSEFPKEAILILDETGLLQYIIPELLDGKGVMQGGHHTTDVWTHNIDALGECPSKDPIVRLATLIHDIAKPHTYKELNGKPTFYNHEIIGSRIAKKIAKRLKLSKSEVDRIFILVRYHMFYYQPENTNASIRRFMKKVGLENIDDILDLRESDRLGSGARKTSWRLEEMKQRMVEQLHQPFSLTDMNINGNDLMTDLKLQPGPQLGKILNELFELVLENPELNTKETLLKEARKKISTNN